MKHQEVSVDFWAMGKSMFMYGLLTAMGWLMLRLFNTVFSLPRRLRTQQENIQATLQEFQRRYPELNVTEEDLKEAEKELEVWNKEMDEKLKKEYGDENEDENKNEKQVQKIPEIRTRPPSAEGKKTI